VEYRELKVPGAWEITPRQLGDNRGLFLEWFKAERFASAVGHKLDLQQANASVSAAGVLRGIHFADVPPGQAKYVTCLKGAVLDVVVDLRVGSPTFGVWDSVMLDDVDRRAIWPRASATHSCRSRTARPSHICARLATRRAGNTGSTRSTLRSGSTGRSQRATTAR
jgi:dTDP-4-dehydrorhamnose 3,5-epimerase